MEIKFILKLPPTELVSEIDTDSDTIISQQETEEHITSDNKSSCKNKILQTPTGRKSPSDGKEVHITDNIPTEEYFSESDSEHPLETIHRVYRKKIQPDGRVQYYVSFKSKPSKRYRTWVYEEDMTPALQKYAKNRKLQITNTNINMLKLHNHTDI